MIIIEGNKNVDINILGLKKIYIYAFVYPPPNLNYVNFI